MDSTGRHIRFFLVIDGRYTHISTMLSHSSSEPRQTLLHKIKNEIGFNNAVILRDILFAIWISTNIRNIL